MSFKDFVEGPHGLLTVANQVLVPLLFSAAFLVFLWGVFNYFFLHGDEDKKRAEGRSFMIWGILGIVLLFSLWGFVNILLSILGWGSA